MKKRTYIKFSGLIILFVGILLMSLAIFLPSLLDVNAYRAEIMANMQQSLNRRVTFGSGIFSMRFGPSFVFDTVTIKEPDGNTDFITAERVTVQLALLPLLEKKVTLSELTLEGSKIRLERNSEGKLNIDDLLKPRADSSQIQLKKIRIKRGEIGWRDLFVLKQGLSVTASNIDLSLDNLSRNRKGSFKLSAQLSGASSTPTLIALSGNTKIPRGNISLIETELDANLEIKQAEPGRFWPYYGHYIPFPDTGGRLDIVTSFKGKLREFSAKGKIRLANPAITWPTVFHHTVNPRLAQLDYTFKLNKDSIEMPSLHLSADGLDIKGSCQLNDITSPDLHIVAKATSDPFILQNFRNWIPYGIIAKDASEYIEEHITGGTFKLESGSLDGRLSQITHMERGTNYNILHIKGTVEKGIVSYGKKVPAFVNIKGGLEMLGKDFILSNFTGAYGDSPFKMEGKITDYPLETPCQYPFKMEIAPRPAEVAWLARLAGANRLEFSGASLLRLKGSGFIPSYNLVGEWDLKQAAYSFPGAVNKQVGTPSQLSFSAVLGAKETRLTSLTYSFAPLNISASALLKYDGPSSLKFELQTNQFMLNDSLPILTNWQAYRPRGKLQAHITGSGNPEDFAAMDYNGSIDLDSFSFLPGPDLKPASNISGSIAFKGNNLETSNMNVMYGSSLINAKGKVRNFKKPEAEITLSSPEFFLRDANVNASRPDISIRKMNASIIVNDNKYRIQNFSGQLSASTFSINGSYTAGRTPEANLNLTSSNLDLDELLLFSKPEVKSHRAQNEPGIDLNLKLAADSAKYAKLPFTRLSASLTRHNGVLYLQNLDAGLFDGKIRAKGRIAPGNALEDRYNLNFSLDHINGERFFKALDISREITGSLNLQGDLTARGATMAEIKKTALGNLRLRLEDGSLRKFDVLSKVFSILNVSQLLKFQLPDMVTGGMPYNEIKGSIAINDGIASSQDLFISGDAINMSIVGSADIMKEELNVTIGVQPLQTVDKIVNRIPVVGWLLTGKDKAVLTAYFEAKGKWSDPQVSAIPVKSMAKGVFNVFRRVFELPMRLFTDTGEVILGQ